MIPASPCSLHCLHSCKNATIMSRGTACSRHCLPHLPRFTERRQDRGVKSLRFERAPCYPQNRQDTSLPSRGNIELAGVNISRPACHWLVTESRLASFSLAARSRDLLGRRLQSCEMDAQITEWYGPLRLLGASTLNLRFRYNLNPLFAAPAGFGRQPTARLSLSSLLDGEKTSFLGVTDLVLPNTTIKARIYGCSNLMSERLSTFAGLVPTPLRSASSVRRLGMAGGNRCVLPAFSPWPYLNLSHMLCQIWTPLSRSTSILFIRRVCKWAAC